MVAGVILVIITRSYPSFRLEETHWLFVLVCVVITLFSIATAIQSKRCIKAIDNGTEVLSSYRGILSIVLDIDLQDSNYSQMTADILESFRETQRQRFYKPLFISLVIAVAANILLFLLLRKGGLSSRRRKAHKPYSYDNNHTPSIDNF